MKIKQWFMLVMLFVVWNAGIFSAAAEEPSQLDDLVTEALANNRELKAARADVQAAKHRLPQASALPDPMVGYSVMGPMLETPLGPQQDVYEFEQEIPFPGKLLEKRKMAAAEVKETEARLKMAEREVAFKVSKAYYDLFTVQSSLKTVQEVYDLLAKLETISQSRYAAKTISLSEVAKAQTEVSDTLQRMFVLRQQRDSLLALLTALLNRREPVALQEIAEPEVPEIAGVDELLQAARQHRPELLAAQAQRQRQQHARTLARYENAPDLTVGFQYIRIGDDGSGSPDDGRDAWMIPIKVTIPLWQNRVGSTIAEARKNWESSDARLEQAENFTEYEVRNAYYQFLQQKQTVELYRNAFLPQAELAFHSDQAGYEAGEADILNLLDSERVYLNARVAYYQVLGEALKSVSMLEWVVGVNLRDQGGQNENF